MSQSNNRINVLVNKGLCSGCGLCVAIAESDHAKMEINQSGYLRPTGITLSTEQQKTINDCCPGERISHEGNSTVAYHPVWGPISSTMTGYATDKEIHHKGSSGGVISGLCDYLLLSGKVDGILQIAVSKDEPLKNVIQVSRTTADILRAAGSRYAPSAPLENITDFLAGNERYAFVGKPCDVAALRRYSLHDKRVAQRIPYLLSFMCAGVPSLLGTYELLNKLGADKDELLSFRYRGDGWPGMATAVQKDGLIFQTDYNSSWGTVLNKHLQFRCKICPDGTGEFADIVCADAWYGKDGYPDFTEREGRSLILVRTPVGETLLHDAVAAGKINTSNLAIEEIAHMQPYQITRKQLVSSRLIGTWLALGAIKPRYQNLKLMNNTLSAKPMEWLRSMAGTVRRAKGEKQ